MTNHLADRSLALVLWGKTKAGKDDVVVFPGMIREIDERYCLERVGESSLLEMPAEWISRIQEIPAGMQEVLCSCELQLSLTIADLEKGEDATEYVRLELKWAE